MRPLTRRALLAGAAAGVAIRPLPALAAPAGDRDILLRLAPFEQALAFTYGAAVNSGSARVRSIATRFAPHEATHLRTLDGWLEAIGAPRSVPPRGPAEVDTLARRSGIDPVLSELRTPEEALSFMLAFEETVVGAWVAAHRKLADARLVQMATGILGCQAQHLVVLREALGRDPLPRSFETAG